jgi:hypothetical protein
MVSNHNTLKGLQVEHGFYIALLKEQRDFLTFIGPSHCFTFSKIRWILKETYIYIFVYSMPIYASKTCKTYNIKALPKHLDPHKHITATSTAKLAVSQRRGPCQSHSSQHPSLHHPHRGASGLGAPMEKSRNSNEWQTTIFGISMVYYTIVIPFILVFWDCFGIIPFIIPILIPKIRRLLRIRYD